MTRNELILQHRGYAKALALQLARGHGIASNDVRDEMIQAAELGLVEAAESFDGSRGFQFTTFAYYRIRGAVLDFLSERHDLPPHQEQAVRDAARFNDSVATMAARADAAAELPAKERLSADSSTFSEAIGQFGLIYLLTRAQSGRQPSAGDAETPDEQVDQAEWLRSLPRAVEALTEQQRTILDLKYRQGLSMKQIGARLGCDKATISRKHDATLATLGRLLTTDPREASGHSSGARR